MPTVNEERELKLIAPAELQIPTIAGEAPGVASITEEQPLDLSATYYDSSDFRLLRHGITLRHRFGEETGPVWTVKLPVNEDDTLRGEVDFRGDTPSPPAEVRDLLTGVLNGSKLEPMAEIKTKRRRWLLRDYTGGEVAELVDDRVSILDGNLIKGSFREIEIESRGGDAGPLQGIAEIIERAGAHPEQRSKASRALTVLHPEALPTQATPRVSPDEPAERAVGPAFEKALRYILQHDPHARLNEVEGVHGMRVGARRLRSAFRTFEQMLDGERVAPVIDDLRWLGSILGEVRDLDVMIEDVAREAEAYPKLAAVVDLLREKARVKRVGLTKGLASERYVKLISSVRRFSESPPIGGDSPGTCAEVMPRLVQTDWRKLKRQAEKLTHESPEPDFHRTRILAKRARYAADTVSAFAELKTERQLKDFARKLALVQNVLGEHQDAIVAAETLLAAATEFEGDSALSLELGRLIEREYQRAREKREEFFGVWRGLDRKKNLKWQRA